MWVRSEYTGELAVLSAWICGLLPWGVTVSRDGIWFVRIHFVYAFFQFAPGSGLAALLETTVIVTEAPRFADNQSVVFGYRLWLLGAAVLTLALVFSVVYYRLDERLESRSPVDPVRLVGGLLVPWGVLLTVATYFVHVGGRGVTVPVGALFGIVLGGLLLVVEQTAGAEEDADGSRGSDTSDSRAEDTGALVEDDAGD